METRAIILNTEAETDRLVDRIMSQNHDTVERPLDRSQATIFLEKKYIIGSANECFKISEYGTAVAQHLAIYFMDNPHTRTLESFAKKYLRKSEK